MFISAIDYGWPNFPSVVLLEDRVSTLPFLNAIEFAQQCGLWLRLAGIYVPWSPDISPDTRKRKFDRPIFLWRIWRSTYNASCITTKIETDLGTVLSRQLIIRSLLSYKAFRHPVHQYRYLYRSELTVHRPHIAVSSLKEWKFRIHARVFKRLGSSNKNSGYDSYRSTRNAWTMNRGYQNHISTKYTHHSQPPIHCKPQRHLASTPPSPILLQKRLCPTNMKWTHQASVHPSSRLVTSLTKTLETSKGLTCKVDTTNNRLQESYDGHRTDYCSCLNQSSMEPCIHQSHVSCTYGKVLWPLKGSQS